MGVKGKVDIRMVCPTCPKQIIGLSLAGTAQHVEEKDHPAWEAANYVGMCESCGADFELTVTHIEGEPE